MGTVKQWRWVRTLRKWRWVTQNLERVYRLAEDDTRYRGEAEGLVDQVDWMKLKKAQAFMGRTPIWGIGTALQLADRLGIKLDIGTCYGDCRAMLPKEKWEHDISPHADPWSYSLFVLQQPEDVFSIQGMSRRLDIAIAQCVVKAQKAGVI